MTKPDLIEYIEYEGKQIKINWFDLVGKDLPNIEWSQVYAIGDLNGLVPIVHYEKHHDNLPGGRTEPGETVEQTLIREMDEELKMKVNSWELIGYQEWIEIDTGKKGRGLRVYAKLIKEEEFINDPGGPVIGHSLIQLEDLNNRIDYHTIGDRMVELVKQIKSRN